MKIINKIWLCSWVIWGLFQVFTYGCRKEEGNLAVLTTLTVINITDSSSTSGGNVTSDGGATVIARGVCWDTAQNPTIANDKTNDGSGTGIFTSNITGLIQETSYYVRAYATNSKGTAYGNEVTFTTLPASGGTLTDIDGNEYNTVIIGTQVWMAENLKVTKYRNGDPIPDVISSSEWSSLTTGGYCNISNDAGLSIVYGRLYNWYAVNDDRNIAPIGWHVSTDADWTTLTNFLGGENVAGGKMRETGTLHWCSPNEGATNESGFTALPGGVRSYEYGFLQTCYWGCWWSATICSDSTAYNRLIENYGTSISRVDNHMKHGMSIRCVRDE